MTRGRKPLPKETLKLRDTFRKDRDRPSSTIGDPIPVEEVAQRCQVSGLQGATKRARDIYWAIVKKVAAQGLLDVAFCSQLLFYAVEYDFFISCCESIRKDGPFIILKDKDGNPLRKKDGGIIAFENRAVKNREKALEKLIKIGSNFGFSPVDRQRLKIQADSPKVNGIKAIFAAIVADDEQAPDEQ